MSAVAESLLDSGRYPLRLYATIWIWQCVLPACVFVCASVGERWWGGWGATTTVGRGKRDRRLKSLWGSSSSAGLVLFVCPAETEAQKSFSPIYSFHSLRVKHMHAHDSVVLDKFCSVIQQNIERYCKEKSLHCAARMPRMFFFYLFSHTDVGRVSAVVSSGCWRPGSRAAF